MPATKRGIFHNLKESKYATSNSEVVFFFSSKFYLTKFMEGYKNHRKIFNHKMSKKTVEKAMNFSMLADLSYYMSTEKRGFRAVMKGAELSCQELNQYALQQMTEPNMPDWYVIQKQR